MQTWVEPLLSWYQRSKRTMPWRDQPDPYAVWVSEMMLQQTQVDTVRPYFKRFLETFPTLTELAAAPESALLKAWEGLGYYNRVRNMQRAAKLILSEHAGRFPTTAAELQELPGIGPYSAAAIASICFGQAVPVVDGNVIRVFARYRALRDDFKPLPTRLALAKWLQPHCRASKDPSAFNQAMMELGALVCSPRNPRCDVCPLAPRCKAYRLKQQEAFPVKGAKATVPTRETTACIVRDSQGRLLVCQNKTKLLGGLWALPTKDQLAAAGLTPPLKALGEYTHVFTHFKSLLKIYTTKPLAPCTVSTPLQWSDAPEQLAWATAHKRILENFVP